MTDVAAPRELRILCLHGYRGSAAVLRSQMALLASAMPATIEFVYADSPSLSTDDFGWWHAGFQGWERTLGWAENLFASHAHFDGLLDSVKERHSPVCWPRSTKRRATP